MKPLHHQILPHTHPGYSDVTGAQIKVQHRAHAISAVALFIYLQIFIFTAIGFYFANRFTPHVLGTATFSSSQIIDLTNVQRAKNSLPILSENQALDQAAKAKAGDMFQNDYWAHFSPQGKTPWQFITAAGYKYIYAGENLARDFADAPAVVEAWMNSPTHRSNVLDKNFKEIGVAVESGKLGGRDGILVVQMFGSNTASPAADEVTQQRIKNLAANTPRTQVAGEQATTPQSKPQPVFARQFNTIKTFSITVVGFIFALFVMELIVSLKASHLKLQSSVVAHLALLAFVLIALWYSTAGAII